MCQGEEFIPAEAHETFPIAQKGIGKLSIGVQIQQYPNLVACVVSNVANRVRHNRYSMNGVNLIVADDRRSILDHRTIEKLVHLQYLSLSTNPVGQIPDAIAKLKQLKNLDLRNNKISTVPQSLSQMLKLRKVCRLHRLPLTRNIQLRIERHIAIPLPLNHHRKPLSSSYRTHTIHFAILHYNLLDRLPQNWSRGGSPELIKESIATKILTKSPLQFRPL